MGEKEVTYSAWVRCQDGRRIDIGSRIPASELHAALRPYSDNRIYKNIFYERNE